MHLAHVDLLGIARTQIGKWRSMAAEEVLLNSIDYLESLIGGEELLLPAFNYDFTRTKRFDTKRDSPQVGVISNAAFRSGKWKRDLTPVYSFISNLNRPTTHLRPFSETSTFAEVIESEGEVLLVGTGVRPLTVIHHWEHLAEIPYRYEKNFTGVVIDGENESVTSVSFHVRPTGMGLDYDFSKLAKFLNECQAATKESDTVTRIHAANATKCVLSKLAEDPFFLLNSPSRIAAENHLNKLGHRFYQEDFE
jgi:aminoglycoside N3'-acetyltransferase